MHLSSTVLLAAAGAAAQSTFDLSDLPAFIKSSSSTNWPTLLNIGQQIWNDPEVGLNETHAHDRIVNYFSSVGGWTVSPSAYPGLPTAFKAEFDNRPSGFTGDLPTVGFLAEYDALVGLGHACGHNLIALNGISAAKFASEALTHYNIPGRIIVIGTPDEENAAGKFKLNNLGAFNGSDVWLMAHPTTTSAIQPMNARLNYFARFVGSTHSEAVSKAYDALDIVQNLSGLPGTSSSAVGIENVGVYATNIVQTIIQLGVAGLSLDTVSNTVSSILDSTYPNVTFSAATDANGVALTILGPGGHASEATKSPLTLSVNTYNALKNSSGVSFYLPGNTSVTELDITIDFRTRYTADLNSVANFASAALGTLPAGISHDVQYPALEVTPFLGQAFIDIVGTPDYGLTNFPSSTFAPASTDASWVQDPVLDPVTHDLKSAAKAVLHANFGICTNPSGAGCAFNHEPLFKELANTDFAYEQTEIVARAEAQLAVELLADPSQMAQAVAIVIKRSN
ncbi:hypothetical protein BBK36DRAFT_1171107 [Trichoderma citrinoviride]|uniref:Peptidase M20 domain-containing protein 2 n=1 Tax=Trichoderma citrinoviride TaxID=58853 RepID=A0A2T4B358_9HYPO|nr:hypothetical protein BBK36DRAFT_1171107 [Trichoderma citrinoviride]PTB63631.1 hypothetical protein BBK36DRAFT_1171107 [Trichoderma citrinoviride]